jgi:hypothetical protein
MLFVGAAVAGGLIAGVTKSGTPGGGILALGRHVTTLLLNVYAMRMAAVFTLTTVTIARHTRIVARWLTIAGLAIALVLLVSAGIVAWVELLFPAWILALSIDILVSRSRASSGGNSQDRPDVPRLLAASGLRSSDPVQHGEGEGDDPEVGGHGGLRGWPAVTITLLMAVLRWMEVAGGPSGRDLGHRRYARGPAGTAGR